MVLRSPVVLGMLCRPGLLRPFPLLLSIALFSAAPLHPVQADGSCSVAAPGKDGSKQRE